MADKYLINTVRGLVTSSGATDVLAGTLITDTNTQTLLAAAGGVLALASDVGVAAAAAIAAKLRAKGESDTDIGLLMTTSYSASDVGSADAAAASAAAALVSETNAAASAVSAAASGMQKATLSITQAAVAALGASTTGSLNIGAALPANAHLAGAEITIATKFQNAGDTATITASVGSAGTAVDACIKDANLHTTGNKGGSVANAPTGYPGQSAGAEQLLLSLTASVNLSTISAGAGTVTVWYFILA